VYALRLRSTNPVSGFEKSEIYAYWDDVHIFGANVISGDMEPDSAITDWRLRIVGPYKASRRSNKVRSAKRTLVGLMGLGKTANTNDHADWKQDVSFGPVAPVVQVSGSDLSWSALSGAVGYKVLRSSESGRGFVEVADVSGTSYSAAAGYYVVVAYNSNGAESTWSGEVSV